MNLTHLTLVKQNLHENISEYIRQFRNTRNRCYSLTISNWDLVDLAFSCVLDFHKEIKDGHKFLDISQVLQKDMANESWPKETTNLSTSNEKFNHLVYALDCDSNDLDDEVKDFYAA